MINLVDTRLEVYRDPVADPSYPSGFRYASRQDLTAPVSVTPLALPHVAIPVADLLGLPPTAPTPPAAAP